MNLRAALASFAKRPLTTGESEPAQTLFIRLLGLIYLSSFASFWPQITALIGSKGIAPAADLLTSLRAQNGHRLFLELPTLFWFGMNDTALVTFCIAGCLLGMVMATGYYVRAAAIACWLLYLSIVVVGQPFSNFQWDALLLEAGFLGIFSGVRIVSWAYRFLLFRLMFESGLVKLLSHDPNWRNLHAMRFHFMTQPLPNPIAYYAYRSPGWMLDSMTAATVGIELIVPFFLFGPRILRYAGAGLLMGLQLLIMITGNYAFFNLLTLALCLSTLDDRTLAPLSRLLDKRPLTVHSEPIRAAFTVTVGVLIVLGGFEAAGMIIPPVERPVSGLLQRLAPFEIVNTYGLFAVMTTTRPEVVIEGSDDNVNWKEYVFPFKPGPLNRSLPVVAPYQPRLDWQMWFAALGTYQENTWVGGLMYRLLTGEPSVMRLLEPAPFTRPPKYIRAMLYEYRFTTPEERRKTGAVWNRTLLGPWFGPASLRVAQP